MKNLNKLILGLLIILFLLLPLINSHLLDIFGIKTGLYVSGNYEFTKVIFFNIVSGIILLLYGIKLFFKKEKIIIPKYIVYIILFLLVSTYLSTSFYTSFFGTTEKGHGLIMALNLIGIFIILINLKEKKKIILLKTSIYSAILFSFIGIKELYFPTFDYGQLSNRIISTFGHPNYISLYLLLIIPFLIEKIYKFSNRKIRFLIILLILTTLLLTKSFIALFLSFSYLFFTYSEFILQKSYTKKKNLKYFLFIFLFFIGLIGIIKFFPEKLSSFFSRFFIWETTIKIILSDIKIFLIGGGLETFSYYFDSFKSPYLYIFEKIGFSADRPHNLILNFFYHLGILGLISILYIYKKLFTNFKIHKTPENISLLLGSIFLLFNFASISSYLLIILIFSLNFNNNKDITRNFYNSTYDKSSIKNNKYIFIIIIFILSISSIYFSTLYYVSEIYTYKNKYKSAIHIFPYNGYNYYKIGEYISGLKMENFKSEKYYLTKIYSLDNSLINCEQLINTYPSVENNFFCGNYLWEIGKFSSAKTFYESGLKNLPDLWNNNSIFYNNIFIKHFISGNRFFSEKYSNINEILERIGK